MNQSDGSPEIEAWEVVVVGAGAAGLIAAATAAQRGRRTLLLEKNRQPGVKILMSGGTRANITQDTDNRGIVAAFGPQGRFLHSALATFGVRETIELFESEGVSTKVEPTGKIFPVSDRAADVLAALLRRLARTTCTLALDEPLCDIERAGAGFRLRTARRTIHAHKLLITTGGQSYPRCGTSGDAYPWAAQLGHTVVTPRPALAPLTTNEPWVQALRGITIPDVALCVVEDVSAGAGQSRARLVLAQRRGSLLFAHFGLSGPVALDVSRVVSGHLQPQSLALECDLLPTVSAVELDAQLRSRWAAGGKKQLVHLLPEQLPRRLLETLLGLAGLSPDQKAAEAGTRVRVAVVDAIKSLRIPLTGTRGFAKAEVTAGGVVLDEVDSRSMQSKLMANLYWSGEVLDLDGPIGGYNFQAAWSTGFLAGQNL